MEFVERLVGYGDSICVRDVVLFALSSIIVNDAIKIILKLEYEIDDNEGECR